MLERYVSFFHFCLLSYHEMFLKRIVSKPKWGAQAVVRGGTVPCPPPCNQGCQNPGGGRDIFPQKFDYGIHLSSGWCLDQFLVFTRFQEKNLNFRWRPFFLSSLTLLTGKKLWSRFIPPVSPSMLNNDKHPWLRRHCFYIVHGFTRSKCHFLSNFLMRWLFSFDVAVQVNCNIEWLWFNQRWARATCSKK